MQLADEKCGPLPKGAKPLTVAEARELARAVPDWSLSDKQNEREFKFDDFRRAMAFVNRLADLAEEQGHHPDIFISYSRVRLTLSTHKIGGLSRNDFILAARINQLADEALRPAGGR